MKKVAAMTNERTGRKWKMFIMCHNVIWDKMYEGDREFSRNNYTFFKLGDHRLSYNPKKNYEIINEFDLPVCFREKNYAEITGLYAIYQNNLHKSYDYIGIHHYDKEHRLLIADSVANISATEAARNQIEVKRRQGNGPTDLTQRITAAINSATPVHICLEAHDVSKIYEQKVMMDDNFPEQFIGDGRNCFDEILKQYNSFFGTNYSLVDLKRDGYLNMCTCFVTPCFLFEKLMIFISSLMESRMLDKFDPKRMHRLQGGLLERYVAVFFALESIEKINMSTVHRYWDKRRITNDLLFNLWKPFGEMI